MRVQLLAAATSGNSWAVKCGIGDKVFDITGNAKVTIQASVDKVTWVDIQKLVVTGSENVRRSDQYPWWRISIGLVISGSVSAWCNDALPQPQGESSSFYAETFGVSADASASDNYAALVAVVAHAQDAMSAGQAAVIYLPPGDILINNTAPIDITDGYRYADSQGGPVNSVFVPGLRGAGMHATRLHPQVEGQALFRVYGLDALSVVGTQMADFSIVGPGKSNANTVGIQLGGVSTTEINVISTGSLDNIHFINLATCIRMDQVSAHEFNLLRMDNFNYGVELGYQCDLNVWNIPVLNGNISAPSNQGTGFSFKTWTPGFSSTGPSNSNILNSPAFVLLVLAMDIADEGTSNWEIHGGYCERINKFAKLGNASASAGVKQFIVDGMHISQADTATYGFTSAAIEVLGTGANVDPYIKISNCRSDTSSNQQWLLGTTGSSLGSVEISSCLLPSAHASGPVSWGGSAFAIPSYGDLRIAAPKTTVLTNNTTVPADLISWRGPQAGKILQKWNSVTNVAAPAQQGTYAQVVALDASGAAQVVAVEGVPRVFANAIARPTAGAAYRGMLWVTEGAGGVTDSVDICLKAAADTYSWRPITTGG